MAKWQMGNAAQWQSHGSNHIPCGKRMRCFHTGLRPSDLARVFSAWCDTGFLPCSGWKHNQEIKHSQLLAYGGTVLYRVEYRVYQLVNNKGVWIIIGHDDLFVCHQTYNVLFLNVPDYILSLKELQLATQTLADRHSDWVPGKINSKTVSLKTERGLRHCKL